MLFSVYATDTGALRDAVVEQACARPSRQLFTSLHMPETDDLAAWLRWMRDTHRRQAVTFWADMSPATLTRLATGLPGLLRLADGALAGLRIDYGFSPQAVIKTAQAVDLPIAVNASTVQEDELDLLTDALGARLVGWHNFYPRPGTGLTREHYLSQSRLVTRRGLRLLAFVPGETSRRAPLHQGLPTMEAHRYRDAYTSALELQALVPGVEIVCAEGLVDPQRLDWLDKARCDVVTLPVVDLAQGCEWLLGEWRLRAEPTPTSYRLLGTRGHSLPQGCVNAAAMEPGSLQIDTLGRYSGEVHLQTVQAPLDGDHLHVGDVAAYCRSLLPLLRGGDTIRLVRA